MRSPSFWTWLPVAVAFALFAGGVGGAGFVADDAFNLATHANDGDWAGEWTAPTYAHAGGERGHIWRPLPAWLQHAAATTMGRVGSTFRGLSLGIHLINVVLLGWVARRMGASATVAGLVSLVWTTHPAMPEAICWSSDIYDLTATTMALLAVAAISVQARPQRLVWMCVLTAAACLCKESSLALVPALAIIAAATRGMREGLAIGAASAVGALAYSAFHRSITQQSYVDALHETPLIEMADAGLMTIGWWAHAPARAPMAHLFSPMTDGAEVWLGSATLVGISVFIAHQFRLDARAKLLLAGLLAALTLLLPAAVGMPFIGVAPLRYIYGPLGVGLAVAAARWTGPAWMPCIAAVFAVAGVGSLRIADRVPAFQSDSTLWAAELALEPTNPYAAGSLARAWIADGNTASAIQLWARAADGVKPGVRVFDKANERWLLAQTAFMKGDAWTALDQVEKLMSESSDGAFPAMAHCLKADSLDALGRREEAKVAGQSCSL